MHNTKQSGLHVAIIMDGNGRWATHQNLPRSLRAFATCIHPPRDESHRISFYSAAASTALVCATVQSGAPTLNRAKRRTVMFSPSLPTF